MPPGAAQDSKHDAVVLHVEHLAPKSVGKLRFDQPTLLAPLQAGVIELERGDALQPTRLDRATMAILPANAPFRLRAVSPVTDVALLELGPIARQRTCDEYDGHVVEPRFAELLANARTLPRTRWVDELLHRYVFERDVCEKHDSAASRFLETELCKELFFMCKERDEARTRVSHVREEDGLVARARALLDASPFSPPSMGALARQLHTSESTLLRAFSRELGCTPAAYIRERRLDAALLLVQSGQHSMGEVATKVGYSNLAAFTAAFHRRFGAPPSTMRGRDESLVRLPPHGLPPRRPRKRV